MITKQRQLTSKTVKKLESMKLQRCIHRQVSSLIELPSFFTPTSSSVSSPADTTASYSYEQIKLTHYQIQKYKLELYFVCTRHIMNLTSCAIFWKHTNCIDSRGRRKGPITKVLDIITNDANITSFSSGLHSFIWVWLAPSNWQIERTTFNHCQFAMQKSMKSKTRLSSYMWDP